MKKCNGFTLIELMVVIGIISILASITTPNFVKVRSQGMIVACKSNLKNAGTVLELYAYENCCRYPQTIDKLSPSYLRMLPTCPASGNLNSYGYTATSLPDAYTIYCSIPKSHATLGYPDGYPQYHATGENPDLKNLRLQHPI